MNFINVLRQRLQEGSEEAIELALDIISEVPLAVLSPSQVQRIVEHYSEVSAEQSLYDDDYQQGGE